MRIVIRILFPDVSDFKMLFERKSWRWQITEHGVRCLNSPVSSGGFFKWVKFEKYTQNFKTCWKWQDWRPIYFQDTIVMSHFEYVQWRKLTVNERWNNTIWFSIPFLRKCTKYKRYFIKFGGDYTHCLIHAFYFNLKH